MDDQQLTWSISADGAAAPDGVSIASGIVAVESVAALSIQSAQAYQVYAEYESADAECTPAAVTIARADQEAASLDIVRGGLVLTGDSLPVPSGSVPAAAKYSAVVYDQYGEEMEALVSFTLDETDPAVTISGDTVRVASNADSNLAHTLKAFVNAVEMAQIPIRIVPLEIQWPTVTEKKAVYGSMWNEIIGLGQDGSASIGGENVPGSFRILEADAMPAAGDKAYTIVFVSDDGAWNINRSCALSNPAGVEKATIRISADHLTAYVGDSQPKLTYKVSGLAEGETLAVQPVLTCSADMLAQKEDPEHW